MKNASAQAGTAQAPSRRRRWPAVAVIVVLLLALAASVWHIVALDAYIAAGRPYDPTAQRRAAAEIAWTLEPWNVPFAWRAIALRGLAMLDAGDVDGAYWLVEPFSSTVHGTDAAFVAIYQKIVAVKTPIDSGKAHVAHGLDPYLDFGPGVARPETPSVPATSSTGASGTAP